MNDQSTAIQCPHAERPKPPVGAEDRTKMKKRISTALATVIACASLIAGLAFGIAPATADDSYGATLTVNGTAATATVSFNPALIAEHGEYVYVEADSRLATSVVTVASIDNSVHYYAGHVTQDSPSTSFTFKLDSNAGCNARTLSYNVKLGRNNTSDGSGAKLTTAQVDGAALSPVLYDGSVSIPATGDCSTNAGATGSGTTSGATTGTGTNSGTSTNSTSTASTASGRMANTGSTVAPFIVAAALLLAAGLIIGAVRKTIER